MDEETRREEPEGQGTPSVGGDLMGPGTGGPPTGAGTGKGPDVEEAAADPDVAALVENLRGDTGEVEVEPDEAAEQAGTGTDR